MVAKLHFRISVFNLYAAVVNSRRGSKFDPYLRASFRGAAMGLFRDRRDKRDLFLKVGWALVVVVTQQLRWRGAT